MGSAHMSEKSLSALVKCKIKKGKIQGLTKNKWAGIQGIIFWWKDNGIKESMLLGLCRASD